MLNRFLGIAKVNHLFERWCFVCLICSFVWLQALIFNFAGFIQLLVI